MAFDVFSLIAKIGLDTSEYDKGLDSAKQKNDGMKSSFSQVGKAAETLNNKYRVLAAQYEAAQKRVDELTDAFNKSAQETGHSSKETQELAQKLKKAEQEADGLKGEIGELSTSTADAGKEIRQAGNEASEAGGKFSGFAGHVSDLAGKLGQGIATAAKIGAAAIGTATAAVGAFAKASIDTGAQFDGAMSQVAATMGTTVDQIGNLRDFAMEMGAKTAFSANEAADALNYMALAGYDAETSMAMLPNVLNLAAAGGIDLAAASDMVTDAQSALGLTLDDTSKLVDKMAMASSKSNTSVAQLGDAILTVGGTAKNLAGGTTELSTALGILSDNGVKGAEGGTALRNIILSLSAPTDTAAKAMKSLGLEVFDAEGNMRPLNDTFGDLDAALSNMTQGEKTQVLSEIFNKVDLKSVDALLANTGERFDELSGYIDNAVGAAENMANTQLDNLSGDVTKFKSALEGAQLIISDGLTPDLRKFVQFGTSSISSLSDAFKEGGLSGAMEAFGGILGEGLGMATKQLPGMVNAGMQLLGALGQGMIENLPTIMDSAGEIIDMLGTGLMDALPGMASAAGEIIATLANGLIGAIPALTSSAGEIILSLANGLTGAAPNIVSSAVTIVTTLVDGLSAQLPLLVPAAVDMILELATSLTDPDNLSNLFDSAIDLIMSLADGLIDALPGLLEKAPEIVQNLVDAIVENAGKLPAAALELVTKLAGAIIENLPQIVDAGARILDSILEGLGDLAAQAFEWGANLLTGLWNGIWDKVDWLKRQVSGVVDTIKSWFTGEEGFDEHSPSKWSEGVAAFVMDGLAIGFLSGKGKVMQTIEDIVGEAKARFGEVENFFSAKSDVADLEYQLWERTDGKHANELDKYTKKLEMLSVQQEDQAAIVEAAQAAYDAVVKEYGEASEASYSLRKALLEEKLAYEDLLDTINQVSNARAEAFVAQEAKRFQTGYTDFADSGLGVSTAYFANIRTPQEASIKLNASLVTPDGAKVAAYYFDPLTEYAQANGTPILKPQF